MQGTRRSTGTKTNRILRKGKTICFHARLFTESSHQAYYPGFSSAKTASEKGRTSPESEMEGVRVRWKWTNTPGLRRNPRSGSDSPESHGPRALPSTLRLDFQGQTSTRLRPRQRTPTPALNPGPGIVEPAAVIKRETSNRWLTH